MASIFVVIGWFWIVAEIVRRKLVSVLNHECGSLANHCYGVRKIYRIILSQCRPGSSVGIGTDYGLDGPRTESWWARFSAVQTGPGAHPASCTMGKVSFPGVKYGPDVLLTTHPLLVSWSRKSRVIPLPNLWAKTGPLKRIFHFLFGAI